jgi:hypothetical protein
MELTSIPFKIEKSLVFHKDLYIRRLSWWNEDVVQQTPLQTTQLVQIMSIFILKITRLTKRIVEANELVVFGNTYLARSVPFVQTSSKANQAQGSVMQEAPSTAMQASMGYKVCRIRANNSC